MPSPTTKRETAQWCGDLARSHSASTIWTPCRSFYEEVIGLPLMARDSNSAFFKKSRTAKAVTTQVLALFDPLTEPRLSRTDAVTSTRRHIAFEILLATFAGETDGLKGSGTIKYELPSTMDRTGALFMWLIPRGKSSRILAATMPSWRVASKTAPPATARSRSGRHRQEVREDISIPVWFRGWKGESSTFCPCKARTRSGTERAQESVDSD